MKRVANALMDSAHQQEDLHVMHEVLYCPTVWVEPFLAAPSTLARCSAEMLPM